MPPLPIRAHDITLWADTVQARSLLPVLMRRLIHEGAQALAAVDFPGHDEAQRPGWDGWTVAGEAGAWVPAGATGWELSVSQDNPGKPNRDWTQRRSLPPDERAQTSFAFVTARCWRGKTRWAEEGRREGLWADVRAYDAEDLAQWLEQSPSTQLWLAGVLGWPVEGLQTLDDAWAAWAGVCRPILSIKLFDEAVAAAAGRLADWRRAPADRPYIVTADSVGEAVAFVFAALEPAERERAIVVQQDGALPGLLAARPSGLLIIADARAEAGAAAAACRHHILLARTHVTVPAEADVRLGPISYGAFKAALIDMEVPEHDLDRIVSEAGSAPTILRRQLAIAPELRVPDWARDADLRRKLVPILLAGAWRLGDPGDEACVVEMAGKPIAEIERDLAELAALPDAPAWAAGGFRGVVSRKDALFAIHQAITEQDLRNFLAVAELVLTLDDPRLDLPEENRWAAGIYGVQREVSGALTDAIGDLLVLLALEGDRLFGARLGPVAVRVESLVAKVLKDAPPRRWQAMSHLRWLAEAAPDAFLDAIEADLRREEPAVFALLRPVVSPMSGCERTELLWALELLAWEPRRFPRVFTILAKLSEVPIDDNWVNKPAASLESLVRYWLPQTAAIVEERIAVVRAFAATRSPIAWDLLLAQLARYGHATPNVRPRRRAVAAGAGGRPLYEDARAFVLATLDLLLEWPDYRVEQLGDILSIIDELPNEHATTLLERAERWAETASDSDRATLRELLRRDVRLWRAKTSEGDNIAPWWREPLLELLERLTPTDLIERHRWLFAEHWVEDPDSDLNDVEHWRKNAERVEIRRTAALNEVLAAYETDGVVALIAGGNAGWWIGRLLAKVEEGRREYWVRTLLARDDLAGKADPVISGVLCAADPTARTALLARLLDDPALSTADRLRALLAAPCDHTTWQLLADRGSALHGGYWRKAATDAYGLPAPDVAFMVDRLLEADRPFMALRTLHLIVEDVEPALLGRVLRAIRASKGDDIAEAKPSGWSLGRAIARVAADEVLPRAELARLEFSFFTLLEHDMHGTPNLDRELAANPGDFLELVRMVYKRDDGLVDHEGATELAGYNAWRILHEGRRVPGTAEDGSIDVGALLAWIDAARALGKEFARSVMTDQSIGTMLSAAPTGTDGHWPHEAVRHALDQLSSDHIATGFMLGKRNARGVVTRGPGGDQERALAARFRAGADAMRPAYPFTSRALDQIATDYEYEALRWDGEDQVDRRLGRR